VTGGERGAENQRQRVASPVTGQRANRRRGECPIARRGASVPRYVVLQSSASPDDADFIRLAVRDLTADEDRGLRRFGNARRMVDLHEGRSGAWELAPLARAIDGWRRPWAQ
jgi:hypothetical protein